MCFLMGRSLNSFEQHYPSVAHLRHESIRTCVLLIFEDDIRVVVRCELFKALRGPGDLALVSPTGSQCLFGYIWNKLLVIKGCQFLGGRLFPCPLPGPQPSLTGAKIRVQPTRSPNITGRRIPPQPARHSDTEWYGGTARRSMRNYPPGDPYSPPRGKRWGGQNLLL